MSRAYCRVAVSSKIEGFRCFCLFVGCFCCLVGFEDIFNVFLEIAWQKMKCNFDPIRHELN